MSFVLWFVDVENATQVTFFCCRFFLVYFCKLSFEKCIVAEFKLPLIDPEPWACTGLYLWASQAKYHFRSKMCQFRRKINHKLPYPWITLPITVFEKALKMSHFHFIKNFRNTIFCLGTFLKVYLAQKNEIFWVIFLTTVIFENVN